MKSEEDSFRDWEGHVFGFGYGTGEPHVIPVLRKFLTLCEPDRGYDHGDLERELTAPIAWLLINVLCHADILEYGASPRGAWLTGKGVRLKDFILSRTNEALVMLACDYDEFYPRCYPDACNCGPDGYKKGRICPNPFWTK